MSAAMYIDTDVVLALAKEQDWLKAPAERKVRGQRLRTSAIAVIEAQFVLEREASREAALRILPSIRRRRIELIPVTSEVLAEAERLRRRVPALRLIDSIHLATAKLEGETIVTSDRLLGLLREVPVDPIP